MINHPLLRQVAVASLLFPVLTTTASASARQAKPQFGYCFRGGGTNCVVDGDTFWIDGEKVRIADIDAPETHQPRCREEKMLGDAATERLHTLLNAGSFQLASISRDTDRYGRKLRIVVRHGASIGETLVAEGLAREWDGARHPWCV
jgi:micrococcal nuclease